MSIQDRQAVRVESDQFISFKVFDDDNRICNEGMALAKDISTSGVKIVHRTSFETEARVELTIALSKDLITAEGIVRNVKAVDDNTFLIGIQFQNISDKEIELLRGEFPNLV